jgi:KUP system potassium uptake protein
MLLFSTWARGRTLLAARLARDAMPVDSFLSSTVNVQRAPGLAVYFTRDPTGVPTVLLHSLKHHHVLCEHVLLLTIQTALLPHVVHDARLHFEKIGPSTGRAELTFGFLVEPDVPATLALLPCTWREKDTRISYVLARQILIPAARPGMPLWQETLFAAMVRLSGSATEYFSIAAWAARHSFPKYPLPCSSSSLF